MNNGPRLNILTQTFTTRDSLGVEGIAASMAADICPIINTVTPRPFYWAFLSWLYYDFIHIKGAKFDYPSFDYYLKKQDYFFVLSQLLVNNPDRERMAGVDKASANIKYNTNDLFEADRSYFKTRFGGMQYYNAGLFTMGLAEYNYSQDFPNLTQYGEELALAFESVIKNTRYYKEYRLIESPIPKDVLVEYGEVINIGLKGFDKCKNILASHLLEKNNERRNESWDYAVFLNKKGIVLRDYSYAREVLYDKYSVRGQNEDYPDELCNVIKGWELVIGRQYFAAALEIMWKFMLDVLDVPKAKNEWINGSLNDSVFDFDLNDKLSSLIEKDSYDCKTFEDIIKKTSGSKSRNMDNDLCCGIKMLVSIYNRFNNRSDFTIENQRTLDSGYDVSLEALIRLFEDYKDKKICDVLAYIMDKWLIRHHYETALSKMLAGRDGFYYRLVDGYYFKNEEHTFIFDMPGNRFLQLTKAMMDLDIIKVGD
ncbi:MAG: hypothetical protein K6E24_00240 [bacterium]|nr:hypothetical protein [bacterium]